MQFYTLQKKASKALLFASLATLVACEKNENDSNQSISQPDIVQFVYTSDSHYGITRSFRGEENVSANIVNAAMVEKINSITSAILPTGNGVSAEKKVGYIDFVVNTGDMANRKEDKSSTLSADASWNQFNQGFLQAIDLQDSEGNKTPIFIVPGNHDVSNAIGHPKISLDSINASSMANIYNYVFTPSTPKTQFTYNYTTDKINYSKKVKGLHLAFVNMWPDSENREFLSRNIKGVDGPVLLFTHDEAEVEAKHLSDPTHISGNFDFSNKFEYLLSDKASHSDSKGNTDEQQRELANFVKENNNIIAYFHGNTNYNEFYTFTGPDKTINLPIFRVDSPMKGEVSNKDESKLSFQLISVDVKAKKMTVRECLWNTGDKLTFGEEKTISWN